jgi:amino-acid N-acetyltransferase
MNDSEIIYGKPTLKDSTSIHKFLEGFKATITVPTKEEVSILIRDFFIAKIKGDIVGVIKTHFVDHDSSEILTLAVHSMQQGKGIGKRLVELVLYESKTMGVKKTYVQTCLPAFYKKMKFNQIEKLPASIKKHKEHTPMLIELDSFDYLLFEK